MADPVDWGSGAVPQAEMVEVIEREFSLAFKACHELEASAAARFTSWEGREQKPEESPESIADEIIVLEWARSTKTYRATVALCRTGYGEQAAMLNRSLFEGMAVAHWVHANAEDAAERFRAALRYDAHLAAELVDRVDWQNEVDEEALEGARLEGEELAEMVGKFGKYGQMMWTAPQSLPKLVNSVEDQWDEPGRKMLWEFYEVAHRDNNQLLHSTVAGLRRAFSRPDPEGGVVWVGPSNVHIDAALFGAHWTYAQTLTLAVERFELPDRDKLGAMLSEHLHYLVPLAAEKVKDVGRNDPCPCQSGHKYKDCHLEQMEAQASLQRARARSSG